MSPLQKVMQFCVRCSKAGSLVSPYILMNSYSTCVDRTLSSLTAACQMTFPVMAGWCQTGPYNKLQYHKWSAEQRKDTKRVKGVHRPESSEEKKQKTKYPQRDSNWLRTLHKQLTKSVVFPPAQQDPHTFSQEELHSFSTHDLMSLAQGMRSVNRDTMKIVVALWRRLDSMNVDEMLTVADIFYHNNVPVPWYISALITYSEEMLTSLNMLSPSQTMRLLFHIKQHGQAPPALLLAIEERMLMRLSDLDLNQVSVMCYLLFTGQYRIHSPALVDQIASKLLQEFETMNPQHVTMLMKMFRFSYYIKVSFYKELGDKILTSGFLKKVTTQTQLMHIAFTYASVRVTHPDLFHGILKRWQETSFQHRLKDVAKVMWACGTLVTNETRHTQCIHEILNQIKRNISTQEVKEYPDNLVDLLMGLALLNIYPHELMDMVFQPDIVQSLLALELDREKFLQLEFLDESITIESPQYAGSRLTEADRAVVRQQLKDKTMDVDLQLRKPVNYAVAAVENILGSQYVQCRFSLPHFKTADILLHYDHEKKAFVKEDSAVDQLSNDKRIQRVVVMLLSRAQTTYNDQPLGILHCKLRQLKALGHLTVVVDADEALSYTCVDMATVGKSLMRHIMSTLETETEKIQNKG